MPMTTKRGRMIIYLDGLLPLKSHDFSITRTCKIIMTKLKSSYLHYLSPHGLKLGRMVTYLDGLLPKTSLDSLIM